MTFSRRHMLSLLTALPTLGFASTAFGQSRDIWSVTEVYDALQQDRVRLLDIRTPPEWDATGVAQGSWPADLQDERFVERLFTARELAEDRPVALICATGRRSGAVMTNLRQAGYQGYIDVAGGMLGSTGWIQAGLPVVPVRTALDALPAALA